MWPQRFSIVKAGDQDDGGETLRSHNVMRMSCADSSCSFFLKYFPEQPGMEAGIHELDCRMFGGDETVPIALLELSPLVLDKHSIRLVAAISPAVDVAGHVRLHKVLGDHELLSKRIDSASFTRTLLRALITNPEDDKPDDYFLVPMNDGDNDEKAGSSPSSLTRYRIVRIDNERVLFDASHTSKRKWRSRAVPHVRSVMFMIAELNLIPIDMGVLREFRSLDTVSVLCAWLECDMKRIHEAYLGAFGSADIVCVFGQKRKILVQGVTLPETKDADISLLVPVMKRTAVYNVVKRMWFLRSMIGLYTDRGDAKASMNARSLFRAVHRSW